MARHNTSHIDPLPLACGMAAKYLLLQNLELRKVVSAIQRAGSKIAEIEGSLRILAFVFHVLDVIAKIFLICAQLAVTTQLKLLVFS